MREYQVNAIARVHRGSHEVSASALARLGANSLQSELSQVVRFRSRDAHQRVASMWVTTVKVSPMNTRLFEEAVSLRDSGRMQEAILAFRRLARSTADPQERGSIVLNEAACFVKLGRPTEARQRMRDAIPLLPDTDEFKLLLEFYDAVLCVQEGDSEGAVRKMGKILDAHQNLLASEYSELYEDIQMRRGTLLVQLQRSREALPILEEALSFSASKEPGFYYHVGLCYLDLGRLEEAKSNLRQSLASGSLSKHWEAKAHYYLGITHGKQRAYAWAKQELELAASLLSESNLRPEHVYENLAEICRMLRLRDEARKYRELARTHRRK